LGSENVTRQAAESALREVGLGPFLDSLPLGLDTMVSERGSTFSVGQRQLVSFARALAHNPRFLILDEATSSVDTRTELMIREALDRLLTGRTSIVIAHRLSTIQNADRILVFHKRRLREQGTHQELLAERGIYYRLYQLQFKDQELRLPVASGGTSRLQPCDVRTPAAESCTCMFVVFPRIATASFSSSSPRGRTERLFRLSAVLGLEAVARSAGEAPFSPWSVHFPFRGRVLS